MAKTGGAAVLEIVRINFEVQETTRRRLKSLAARQGKTIKALMGELVAQALEGSANAGN